MAGSPRSIGTKTRFISDALIGHFSESILGDHKTMRISFAPQATFIQVSPYVSHLGSHHRCNKPVNEYAVNVRKAKEYLQQANIARIEPPMAVEHHAALAAMYTQRAHRLEFEISLC